jgi:hypothetical protein
LPACRRRVHRSFYSALPFRAGYRFRQPLTESKKGSSWCLSWCRSNSREELPMS